VLLLLLSASRLMGGSRSWQVPWHPVLRHSEEGGQPALQKSWLDRLTGRGSKLVVVFLPCMQWSSIVASS
jgi:hypothetical protein